MKFKEDDIVKTLVEKDGWPSGSIGIIVRLYTGSDCCVVEFLDTDGDPADVITYETKDLELF